jgi:hypothetical protein
MRKDGLCAIVTAFETERRISLFGDIEYIICNRFVVAVDALEQLNCDKNYEEKRNCHFRYIYLSVFGCLFQHQRKFVIKVSFKA